MEAATSSFNIVTFMLIGMLVLVIVSFITLAIYFFGGRSPLERNALGRMEAALAPAEVLRADRQYHFWRFVFVVFIFGCGYGFLFVKAREPTIEATQSFFEAVSITARAAWDGTVALAQELGIGNECECSDPARIGGNGP